MVRLKFWLFGERRRNVRGADMFQLKNLVGITTLSLCLLNFSPAAADIYRYVDEKGTVHFSNVPTDNRYRLYVRSGSSHTRYDSRRYDPIIREMAKKYGIDSDLVRAVIKAESDFDPAAVSRKGARGLMQLMPETARDMEVRNIFAPRENIEGGVKYLRRLLNIFENNLPLSLAAYNAGENVVKQYQNRIPPYEETREYVKRVLRHLQNYKSVVVSSR